MNYTQAQIDRANAVSLEDFLRTQGETLIKSGREYRWKEHDSLTVRGNKWFRHSQSKGGYPIDFVMEFYGKSFPEAVQLLTGESGEGQSEASTAPPTAFHLPLHNRTADRAIQYLCESRGLNKTLVETFLLSGDIYEDAKRHNVVFVGRDRSGTPRYAHVRGRNCGTSGVEVRSVHSWWCSCDYYRRTACCKQCKNHCTCLSYDRNAGGAYDCSHGNITS